MTNPIRRTKEFVDRHRTSVAFSAGALTGATVVVYAAVKHFGGDIYAIVPPEKLQALIDDPSGAIRYPFELSNAYIVSTEHPKFKQ
jgi:hypothetical protein